MSIWLWTAFLVGGVTAFTIWVVRIVRQNDKLDTMANTQKQRADAAEDAANVLVNNDWAKRLRDKADAMPED